MPKPKIKLETFSAANRQEWREWLQENHKPLYFYWSMASLLQSKKWQAKHSLPRSSKSSSTE